MNPRRREMVARLASLTAMSLLPAWEAQGKSRTARPIPLGYQRIAREVGVPAVILFAVALQESQRLFGIQNDRRPLPWPWTLNVEGTPERFASRSQATAQLDRYLHAGKSLIDVGLMQVCWHYFHDRMHSASRALDPYWNLRLGAAILREHFDTAQSWFVAIGRYHAPADTQRATRYAARVVQHMETLLHA